MTMKLEIDDLSHPDVHALLNEHLQATPNVEIENRPGVELVVDVLTDRLDFADALFHASYRKCTSVATFDDRKFARRASAAQFLKPVDEFIHLANRF
jgi:hypothetical protein